MSRSVLCMPIDSLTQLSSTTDSSNSQKAETCKILLIALTLKMCLYCLKIFYGAIIVACLARLLKNYYCFSILHIFLHIFIIAKQGFFEVDNSGAKKPRNNNLEEKSNNYFSTHRQAYISKIFFLNFLNMHPFH